MTIEELIIKIIQANPARGNRERARKILELILWQCRPTIKRLAKR